MSCLEIVQKQQELIVLQDEHIQEIMNTIMYMSSLTCIFIVIMLVLFLSDDIYLFFKRMFKQ